MDFGSVTAPKKIIPLRLQVGQQEYFGKKEVLLYVDVFIFKTSTSEIKKCKYLLNLTIVKRSYRYHCSLEVSNDMISLK